MIRRWWRWWFPRDERLGRVQWPTRAPIYAPPMEPQGRPLRDLFRDVRRAD